MADRRFILNASRSSKQGTLINVGKDSEEYRALTTTMTMAAEDMAAIGLTEGQSALVRTEFGEASFRCEAGKIPEGMIFVAYGPPTCQLMGGDTDGTGMPTSKGWEVDVIPQQFEARISKYEAQMFEKHSINGPDSPHFSTEGDAADLAAWTEVDTGRFMPRRVRGSYRGRALG